MMVFRVPAMLLFLESLLPPGMADHVVIACEPGSRGSASLPSAMADHVLIACEPGSRGSASLPVCNSGSRHLSRAGPERVDGLLRDPALHVSTAISLQKSNRG